MNKENDSVFLSIVIPAFNESKRLPATFSEIKPWLDVQKFSYEIIVIDDASKDDTSGVCKRHQVDWPQLKCVRLEKNQGKGAGVKIGCLQAQGENVLIMDADCSTPIQTLADFLPLIKQYDLVVGVRTFSGDGESSGKFRRVVGLIQQLLAHIVVFERSVADSQCGFKLLSQRASRIIFSQSRVKGGMFDCELFFLAHKHNLRIYSMPVKWVHKAGSTINIPRCIIFDPISLLSIRFNDWVGLYKNNR